MSDDFFSILRRARKADEPPTEARSDSALFRWMKRSEYVTNTLWNREDETAVREGTKEAIDTTNPRGRTKAIQEALWHGYSLTDIGAQFGLTRERVRQIVEAESLERPFGRGAHYRMWDPESEQFVPVTRQEIVMVTAQRKRESEAGAWEQEIAIRWNEAITATRAIARQEGRAPTLYEVARRVFDHRSLSSYQASLLNHLDPAASREGRYSKVSRDLFDLAGFAPPERGGAGFPENRPKVESA